MNFDSKMALEPSEVDGEVVRAILRRCKIAWIFCARVGGLNVNNAPFLEPYPDLPAPTPQRNTPRLLDVRNGGFQI